MRAMLSERGCVGVLVKLVVDVARVLTELSSLFLRAACLALGDLDSAARDAESLQNLFPLCSDGYLLRARVLEVAGEVALFCWQLAHPVPS
jgi:hypothetical protein